jgi:hypothetical protein
MVKTFATLAFIAAAAGGAAFLAQKQTVIDGKVMATDLLGHLGKRGITDVACDDRIPVGTAGAVFNCTVAAGDGSTAKIEFTMDRKGSLSAKEVDSTGPTRENLRREVPQSSDPWGN